MAAGTLSRSTGGVVNVVAGGGGGTLGTTDVFTLSANPGLSASNIFPYITTNGNNFGTTVSATTPFIITPNGVTSPNLTGATAATNVVETASDFVPTGGVTVGSLIISGAGPFTIVGNNTLTLGWQRCIPATLA